MERKFSFTNQRDLGNSAANGGSVGSLGLVKQWISGTSQEHIRSKSYTLGNKSEFVPMEDENDDDMFCEMQGKKVKQNLASVSHLEIM